MTDVPQSSVAAPRQLETPICNGDRLLTVRAWSMAKQDELMPHVAKLIEEWMAWQQRPKDFSLAALIVKFHAEVALVCQITVREELKKLDLEWGQLAGEDLFVIAQSVWLTSIARPDGGGLLGKPIALLGPLFQKSLAAAVRQSATPPSPADQSASPPSPGSATSDRSSQAASPSSPVDGAPAPTASGMI